MHNLQDSFALVDALLNHEWQSNRPLLYASLICSFFCAKQTSVACRSSEEQTELVHDSQEVKCLHYA